MKQLPDAPTPCSVLETALYVDDLETAKRFYAEVMGFSKVVEVPGRHVFFRVGTTILLLFDPKATASGSPDPSLPVPGHGATGPGHLCFTMAREDLDAWRARLEAAGHPVEADFEWPNGARSLYFRDPFGHSLELAEARLWGIEDPAE